MLRTPGTKPSFSSSWAVGNNVKVAGNSPLRPRKIFLFQNVPLVLRAPEQVPCSTIVYGIARSRLPSHLAIRLPAPPLPDPDAVGLARATCAVVWRVCCRVDLVVGSKRPWWPTVTNPDLGHCLSQCHVCAGGGGCTL